VDNETFFRHVLTNVRQDDENYEDELAKDVEEFLSIIASAKEPEDDHPYVFTQT